MADYLGQVRSFIVENFLFGARDAVVGEDKSFLESGIVDSLGMLEIVTWIQETYGHEVPEEDLTPENFDTVRRVASYLERELSTA